MENKLSQANRMKAIFLEFDSANQFCADCNKDSMDFASINNGIIICEDCAEKHKKLGNGLSYLRSFNEKWDEYLINYIKAGGNSRFTQFVRAYHLTQLTVLLKYRTRASKYYREIIRSEVMGYEPPDNINLNTASEILDVIPNEYPEFDNYTFVKHVDLDTLERKYSKPKVEENQSGFFGFFGNVTKHFDTIKNKVADIGGTKLNELKQMTKGVIGNLVGEKEENKVIIDVKLDEEHNINSEIHDEGLILPKEEPIIQKAVEEVKKEEPIVTQTKEEEQKQIEPVVIKEEPKEEIEEKKDDIEELMKKIEEKVNIGDSSIKQEKKEENTHENTDEEEDEFTKKIKEIERMGGL